MSKIYLDWGKAAGVNVVPEENLPRYKGARRRYPFHSHEVRDTIVTLCRRLHVDLAVGNFIVGHDLDPAKYDKSPKDDENYFRDGYSKLARLLNLITGKETMIREEVKNEYEEKYLRIENEMRELKDDFKTYIQTSKSALGKYKDEIRRRDESEETKSDD